MVDFKGIGERRKQALIASMAQTKNEIMKKYDVEQGNEKDFSGWNKYLGYWKIKKKP